MLWKEIRSIKADVLQLRSFGLLIAGIFFLLNVMLFVKQARFSPVFAGITLSFSAVSLIAPRLLSKLYVLWMSIALIMGWFMTRLILTFVYFCLVTPIGIIMRCSNKHQFLDTKIRKDVTSYWIERNEKVGDGSSSERQF